MQQPQTIQPYQLIGNAFAALLRARLPAKDYKKLLMRNRDEFETRVCHSHDFCDANMIMAEAFTGIIPVDSDQRDAVWSRAWAYAKRQNLTAPL